MPGVLQGLFAGEGRAVWVVYDDGGVPGRRRLDLRRLPRGVQFLDVMGNDSRRDGVKVWEIGIQPLFVLSEKLAATALTAAAQEAVRE